MNSSSLLIRVTGSLRAPVVLPHIGFMPGDALLHAAAVIQRYPQTWTERPPDVWDAITLPLVQSNGIYHASCVRLLDGVWGRMTLAKAADTPVLAGPTKRIKKKDRIVFVVELPANKQFMYRLAIEEDHTYFAPEFEVLFAVPPSRLAEFESLVALFPRLSLGAHRHHGYGQIGAVRITPAPELSTVLTTSDGAPLRPLPTTLFSAPPPASLLRRVRLTPPYWHGQYALAYCPRPVTLYGQEADHHGYARG